MYFCAAWGVMLHVLIVARCPRADANHCSGVNPLVIGLATGIPIFSNLALLMNGTMVGEQRNTFLADWTK